MSHDSFSCESFGQEVDHNEMDYSENSDEEIHYHDPDETYEQDLHSSNPGIATNTDSSPNWQDNSSRKTLSLRF